MLVLTVWCYSLNHHLICALSRNFGMKLNLAACLHSKSIYIMLKSMNTIYRELVLIYVLNMHGLNRWSAKSKSSCIVSGWFCSADCSQKIYIFQTLYISFCEMSKSKSSYMFILVFCTGEVRIQVRSCEAYQQRLAYYVL